MIKIAICDDETIILDEVLSYIKKYSKLCGKSELEVFPFSSASSLLNSIDNGALFDIFMLDVYIGDEMGTELAREIRRKGIESPIVFLTTSIEHAPESLETGTLRYLIKPLKPEKFYEAMDVAYAQAEALSNKFIKLKTDNGNKSVNVSRIIFTEAHGHYQYLTLVDGSMLRVRITVTELFDMLENMGDFIRCGSAYIINVRKIRTVMPDNIVLINEKIVPIPRGNYSAIKKAFWELQYEGQED